jgi:hypothetical protein
VLQIIKNITTKPSGVFLWVVVVVASLKEGLTDGAGIFFLAASDLVLNLAFRWPNLLSQPVCE